MNTEKNNFKLVKEPTGTLYRKLLDYASSSNTVVLLVVRPDIELSDSGNQILSDLHPFLVKRERSANWPGTQLFDAEAEIFYFRLLPESVKILTAATDRLYGWCQPDLPEDLCFLSEERTPWLITIAHEQDGYLRLNEWERVRLIRALPDLRLALES